MLFMHIPLSYTCTHILDMLFRDINITCHKIKISTIMFIFISSCSGCIRVPCKFYLIPTSKIYSVDFTLCPSKLLCTAAIILEPVRSQIISVVRCTSIPKVFQISEVLLYPTYIHFMEAHSALQSKRCLICMYVPALHYQYCMNGTIIIIIAGTEHEAQKVIIHTLAKN